MPVSALMAFWETASIVYDACGFLQHWSETAAEAVVAREARARIEMKDFMVDVVIEWLNEQSERWVGRTGGVRE
jgi:hypothetical protein